MISLIKAGSKMFALKSIEYAKDKNVAIEIKGLENNEGTIISNESSKEKILFIDNNDDELKVVFKGMDVFNEIFKDMVNEKIKLESLVIVKDIIYLKGNENNIKNIINKYL